MLKLGSRELRKQTPPEDGLPTIDRNPIYLVLDSVFDTYNIGSLFRLADAIAVKDVYLCGEMEYPPSSRIHKAAVGTENWTPWKKSTSAIEAVKELKEMGVTIVSVEQDPRSINYANMAEHIKFPVAIVVGNETTGVSKEVLDVSDVIVELPMYGINKSFNVWGSAAVVCYQVLSHL